MVNQDWYRGSFVTESVSKIILSNTLSISVTRPYSLVIVFVHSSFPPHNKSGSDDIVVVQLVRPFKTLCIFYRES